MRSWVLLASMSLLVGCVEFPQFVQGPSPGTTGSDGGGGADEVRVVVDPTTTFQVMDGLGANVWAFSYVSDLGWDWEATRFVFDELDLRYVRLISWLYYWETTNDDGDPWSIHWDGFQTELQMMDWHDVPFAQWLARRGVDVTLSVEGAPAWMSREEPGILASSAWPELGETIAAYVLYMQQHEVEMATVEVTGAPAYVGKEGSGIWYDTAKDATDAAETVVEVLDHFGLSHLGLRGPGYHEPRGAAAWISEWLKNDRVRERTAAATFYTWNGGSYSDYDAVRQVAGAWDMPIWVMEAGYCGQQSGCAFADHSYLLPETWDTAWDIGKALYQAIAWADASRIYHWTALGWDAFVAPGGKRFPTFYVFKHFANFIPEGAVRVEALVGGEAASASASEGLLPLVFALPEGGFTAILLNVVEGEGVETVSLDIAGAGQLSVVEAISSHADAYDQDVSGSVTVGAAGRVEIPVPRGGLTSIRLALE